MNIPEELRYTKSHEWLKEEDGVCTVGLTDFAQHALGDIVFVNLPQEGDPVTAGEALGDVESVKAVSDVLSPVGVLVHPGGQRGAAGQSRPGERGPLRGLADPGGADDR